MKNIIIKVCAMVCLMLAVILSWNYNASHYPGAKDLVKDDSGDGPIVEKEGTFCTLKSNVLDGVPIYDQAGSTFQIALVPEGRCCQLKAVTTRDGVEWSQIDFCGLTGWMESKNLHFISDDKLFIQEGDQVFMISITEKGIRAYEEPSASSKEVADGILYGDEFVIEKLEKGWGRIKIRGRKAWVNMYHMGTYATRYWKVQTLTSSAGMNLRQKPGEDQKILTKVPEKTKLKIKKFHHGWGNVTYEGQDGWLMLRYMIPAKDRNQDQN